METLGCGSLHAVCLTVLVKKTISITEISSWKDTVCPAQWRHCSHFPLFKTRRFCCTNPQVSRIQLPEIRQHLIPIQEHCKSSRSTGSVQNPYSAALCCQHTSFSATAISAGQFFIAFGYKQARNPVFPFSYLYFFQSSSEGTYWHSDHICIQMMACCWKKSLLRGWLTSFQMFTVPDQESETGKQLTAWLISEFRDMGSCILYCSLWKWVLPLVWRWLNDRPEPICHND